MFRPPYDPSHRRASALMGEVHRLRHMWDIFRPPPPLKKSDLALMGALSMFEARGATPPTVGSLAQKMHQTPSSVTQKVNRLEALGFLLRVPDKHDRRVVYVKLTAKGKKTAAGALSRLLERIDTALELMGTENADNLIELLGLLCDTVENMKTTENQKGADGV